MRRARLMIYPHAYLQTIRSSKILHKCYFDDWTRQLLPRRQLWLRSLAGIPPGSGRSGYHSTVSESGRR